LNHLIYIDETGTVRNTIPIYARSEKGKRAKCENFITPGTRISIVGIGINDLVAVL